MKFFIGNFDKFSDSKTPNENEKELLSKVSVGDLYASKAIVEVEEYDYLKIGHIGIVTKVLDNEICCEWEDFYKGDKFKFSEKAKEKLKLYVKSNLCEITNSQEINLIFGNLLEKPSPNYRILLEANKNLILTGAPGTGKTYLAKQIAELMGAVTEFVQFHPSYDYTDFVEGLRPTPPDENGNIGFELKDGVFKEFCKNALKSSIPSEVDNFEESWNNLILKVRENISKGQLTKIGNWDYNLNSKDNLKYTSTDTPSKYYFSITKTNIYDTYQGRLARPSGAFQKDMNEIVAYMKENFGLKDYKPSALSQFTKKNFVFIIDEINRAEISKVFGELFFSIDAGYRGEKGRVKTQYANLQDEGDVFYDGFYIPDNVYIIGTMNDIDRSVESMDFAMRRRFAWQEIKPEDRISMWWGSIDEFYDEAERRMKNLNKTIEEMPELGSAYCIGPAYFLKLNEYNGDFKKLWDNHIQGLLFEYLRGLPNSEELLEKLEKEYYKETKNKIDTTDGTEND